MGLFRRSKNKDKKRELKEIAKLVTGLKSENTEIRTESANSLASKGETAVEHILPVLEEDYSGARAAAVYSLGKIGDKSAFKPILEKLRDENIQVQSLAISALGKFRDKRAIEPILPFLRHHEKDMRISAIGALNMIGNPKILPYLVVAYMHENDEKVAQLLVGAILSPFSDRDKQEALFAIFVAGFKQNTDAAESLLKGLSDDDADFRWATASSLGRLRTECAVEPLIRALKDENQVVRLIAAEALGMIGNTRAIKALKNSLRDTEIGFQEAALKALDLLGEEAAVTVEETGSSDFGTEEEKVKKESISPPKLIDKAQKGIYTYEKYWAENTESAKNFLVKKKVDRPNYYITVETPEANKETGSGVWGRDKNGLYLTKLFDWQKDLWLADCDARIKQPPTTFSLQMVTQLGQVDNFVCHVQCGECGHEWLDGLQYQDITIVLCPNCKKYNKVDSRQIIVMGSK